MKQIGIGWFFAVVLTMSCGSPDGPAPVEATLTEDSPCEDAWDFLSCEFLGPRCRATQLHQVWLEPRCYTDSTGFGGCERAAGCNGSSALVRYPGADETATTELYFRATGCLRENSVHYELVNEAPAAVQEAAETHCSEVPELADGYCESFAPEDCPVVPGVPGHCRVSTAFRYDMERQCYDESIQSEPECQSGFFCGTASVFVDPDTGEAWHFDACANEPRGWDPVEFGAFRSCDE